MSIWNWGFAPVANYYLKKKNTYVKHIYYQAMHAWSRMHGLVIYSKVVRDIHSLRILEKATYAKLNLIKTLSSMDALHRGTHE